MVDVERNDFQTSFWCRSVEEIDGAIAANAPCAEQHANDGDEHEFRLEEHPKENEKCRCDEESRENHPQEGKLGMRGRTDIGRIGTDNHPNDTEDVEEGEYCQQCIFRIFQKLTHVSSIINENEDDNENHHPDGKKPSFSLSFSLFIISYLR